MLSAAEAPPQPRIVAVVLAGGASRRFGSDKLAADLDGITLLDRTLMSLPDSTIVVVGPARPTVRTVRFVREEPVGGGPTAALIAGLVAALEEDPDVIVVLPGDAPAAGFGAELLHTELRTQLTAAPMSVEPVTAVVATDDEGRDQPLQLALRRAAAEQLIELAGPNRGAGESARALLSKLEPPALRLALPADQTADIDTAEDLAALSALS